ncbi:His-Xaa-Ser system radical SAM maturase HxsC [Denitromonas halophila]|uniref:His-Xaa-Ser system radical SAM maturase HxsC n=1 Tax=Denitromonas halophila TaxID=1629404 RepID=A0A557QJM4_9RHOO|nr:His-Xaa-Ser system radical SAM maturase HxsC [Denitromonas halophila]TVO53067.1 His-Xaa-Ser system radical SAM maturase HxsC [Denitromonas halophila]
MLKLSGKVIQLSSAVMPVRRQLFLLSTNPHLPVVLRGKRAFLVRGNEVPEGFRHYLAFDSVPENLPAEAACTVIDRTFAYLAENDVIAIGSDGRIRSLYRASSPHNAVLITERCNNYCLMCSQPPKDVDDGWLMDEAMELIRMIPRHTAKIMCITGGEPTIYGEDFISLVGHFKRYLPHTSLHILSNGRRFADREFARKYAAVGHPEVMVGIPVYSSDPARHDYVVQAKGAFDETLRGILNLKEFGQRVEIRVVVHKQTCDGLPALAEFITRNLLFIDQVALMGLEMTGFTRANLDSLWIDPIEYKDKLSEAVRVLSSYRVPVSVYNHPLCLVNPDVEEAYVRSISDWKNEYALECQGCTRKHDCGGFFSSGIQHGYSQSLKPFT